MGRVLRSGLVTFTLPIGIGLLLTSLCLFWASDTFRTLRAQTRRDFATSMRLAETRLSSKINSEYNQLREIASDPDELGGIDSNSGLTRWNRLPNSDLLENAHRPAERLNPKREQLVQMSQSDRSDADVLESFWQHCLGISYLNSSKSALKHLGTMVLCNHSQDFILAVPIFKSNGELVGLLTKSIQSKEFLEELPKGAFLVDTTSSSFIGHNSDTASVDHPGLERGEIDSNVLYSSARTISPPNFLATWRAWCSYTISEVWSRPQVRNALNYPAFFILSIWGLVFAVVKTSKRSRDRQRQLIGNLARRIIWITNESGTIDYVLGRVTSQLGWKEVDYSNVNIGLFVHPQDRDRLVNSIRQAKGMVSREITIEARFETKEREYRWYEVAITDMTDVPEINGIVVTAHDIELRKHATEHILASKRAAEKANEAKSEFLSRMSHELRTPLNAILGFGQLLEMEPITDRQSENVGQILIAGRHLLNLVNDILDIARIETRKVNLSVETVSIRSVVQESFALLGPLAAKQNVKLIFEDDDCPNIWSDHQRLKQVLLNLISNGIKYNSEEGSVWVRTIHNDHGLNIEVTDSGIGIESHYLERVFTPFDRLGADNSQIEGSGLGLALSKTLVEAMGATMDVTSVYGQGSTFRIHFKASSVVVNGKDNEPIETLEEFTFGNPGDLKILLVEDNVVNLRYVTKVVEKTSGVALMSAREGGIGIEMAKNHNPDLVLLDLDLPDLPGKEVLRTLRSDEKTASTRIIVMSAETNPHVIEEVMVLGADEFVTKPVDVNSLIELFSAEHKAA